MSYWKRVYYRPDDVLGEVLGVKDGAQAAEQSGYKQIRESMKVGLVGAERLILRILLRRPTDQSSPPTD
jgi:hypothetical protein